ncbi:MAG: aspartate aminotransferase family protein [Deltaproteobacteria bacterium]|nr:MAG: aspartate aminotransferase family protein [Deltaproteobacteria bacterium]
MQNYRQPPIVMARGQGVELFDVAGRRYLDMTAGIAVCALGHAHPALAEAIAQQARTLVHTSNLYFIEQQILLAEDLARISFADRVFFCNSGAEANEAALKLARRYHRVVRGEPRDVVVSTDGSFHGRSFATVSITGQGKYREGFGPLVGPVRFVPFDDLDAAERALAPRDACAMIVEPIQAEGGIHVPSSGYLAGLRELCDRTGTLLVFDEVQTGIGRTGRWFGYEHDGVAPDVMTLAKALGGGVPIGACAATEAAAQGLAFREGGPVPHASTFGGNPLACAAARAVLRTIEDDGLLAHAAAAGDVLGAGLAELVAAYPGLCVDARGRGLLRGIALARGAADVVARCRDRGLLVSVAGGTVVRFAPALIVDRAHIDEALAILRAVLDEVADAR